MGVAGAEIGNPGHHDPAPDADDIDLCAVQLRQSRGAHHLVRRPDPVPAPCQIEHAVHQAQDGVDLVRDEDDGGAGAAAPLFHQAGEGALVVQVEGEQGFVAEQDPRVGGERLRDADALLLAAGEPSEGNVRVGRRTDRIQQVVHPAADRAAGEWQPPAVAVESEAHQVAGAQQRVCGLERLLGHISDVPAATAWGVPEDGERALAELLPAEQHPQQAGLARSVRSHHGEELPRAYIEIEPSPQNAAAVRQCRATQADHGLGRQILAPSPGHSARFGKRSYGLGAVHHVSNACFRAATLAVIQLR